MLTAITDALRPKPIFENKQCLNTFRLIAFTFLFINLIELVITASHYNQWPNQIAFPSRFYAIIGTLGLLLLLEFLKCFIFRRAAATTKYILYVIPTVCTFLFYYQGVVLSQASQDPNYQVFEGLYEIILYKIVLICFCPNLLTQMILLVGDTVLMMIKLDYFHTTRGISFCLLNLLIPLIILRLPNKFSKPNSRFVPDETHSSNHEASEWIDELLDHLPDGVVVFREDGLVKYFNHSVVSLLESDDCKFIDDLLKLPNKDLLSDMQIEKSYSLLPSLIRHYKSDPLRVPNPISKAELNKKSKAPNTSTPLDRFKANKPGNKRPRTLSDNVGLFNGVESPRALDFPSTILQLENSQGRLVPSNAKPMSPGLKKRRFSVQEQLVHHPIQTEALKDLQDASVRENQLNIGDYSIPQQNNGARHRAYSTNRISINLERTSPRTFNELEKEEFADNERIAQDQATKINFKGQFMKNQLLSGEKKSSHSSVGDAVISILAQISQKLRPQAAKNIPLKTRHSYSYAPRLSVKFRKQATRAERRVNTVLQDISKRKSESEARLEDAFTGQMTMNSYLRIGPDQIRYLSLSFSSIQVKSQTYLLVSVKDTTNQDIASRLSLLDKKKNQMLAMVSHEYRSPLNGIVSMLEILSEKISPIYDEKFIKPALSSAKRLVSLVNDILDFHQLENQKLKFVYQPCVLKDIIKSAMSVVEILIKSRGLELDLIIDRSLPRTIVTDANRLQQIILNLLSNALKFTLKGGITVKASSYREGRVLLEVIDTGIGIKEEDLSKLFKEFGKIDLGSQTSLNPQGVGLGLQISNALAKNLNLNPKDGGLRVSSKYGLGTTFSFIIDDYSKAEEENFYHADEDSIEEPPSAQKGGLTQTIPAFTNGTRSITFDFNHASPSERKLVLNIDESPKLTQKNSNIIEGVECPTCARFLIVDDDDFNLFSVKNLLEAMGITKVDTASNGIDAIKLINEKAKCECHDLYSVVFMDCEMPVLNGFETTKRLTEMINSGTIPKQTILGVTGHAGKEYHQKCMQSGMYDVMTKPLIKKEFTKRLVKLLKDGL